MNVKKDPAQDTPSLSSVKVIPLGGLGKFGMNCMVIESEGRRLIIDCGVQFPSKEHYGIDLLIPDFSFLEENVDAIDGIVLTHAHEDHVGGVPYLLRAVGMKPVYGTAFTLELVHRRLKEHGLHRRADLRVIQPGAVFEAGVFSVEPIHVNHSTPSAVSLAIGTSAGRIIHTGDWRIDYTPVGEPPIDLHRFASLGAEGVLAMIGDSTNVQVPGSNPSEKAIGQELEDVLDLAPGRALITLFSSNVWRVRSILQAARRTRRKVAILGRSMQQYSEVATKLGFMGDRFDDVLIDAGDAGRYDDDELAILLSGSQGEERSTLTRVVLGTHRLLKVKKGDWLVYSNRFIPGNERAINRVINAASEQGANVITSRDRPVHCSGHARREEIKLLINLVCPRVLIPAHGEYQQMFRHAELATELGVPSVSVLKDGDIIEIFSDGSSRKNGVVSVGQVFVDGKGVGDVEENVVRERRKIGAKGIVIASITLDTDTGELLSTPFVLMRGVMVTKDNDNLLPGAREAAGRAVTKSIAANHSQEQISESVRLALRRYFNDQVRRKPTVIPIINEL